VLHELNIKRFVAIIVLTMSTHFSHQLCSPPFLHHSSCLPNGGGGGMWWRHDEQSLLLAWSIHKYGGMGQSVWLSSLAIQPENGKSCFF
jgi:hypothetical protein